MDTNILQNANDAFVDGGVQKAEKVFIENSSEKISNYLSMSLVVSYFNYHNIFDGGKISMNIIFKTVKKILKPIIPNEEKNNNTVPIINNPKYPDEINKTILEIIEKINTGDTVVFCGAGISRNSGIPIVDQLVTEILEKFEVPKDQIQIILKSNFPFEAFVEILRENSNIDKILDIYDQGDPNTNHHLFAKLLKAHKLKTIVTTNFDRLIEKALEQENMIIGKDYDVIYREEDFNDIDWNNNRIRIIKVHGSIDDKDSLAIILKRIADEIFMPQRKIIIDYLFSTGQHKNVLVFGYSSSDTFDLIPDIESINDNRKKVIYVQHSNEMKVQDLHLQNEKNPFKQFKDSIRLFYNTDQLIKRIWSLTINDCYEEKISQSDWKIKINGWYQEVAHKDGGLLKYEILSSVFKNISEFKIAEKYLLDELNISESLGDNYGKLHCLANLGNISSVLGKYLESIEYYQQSLKGFRKNGNKKYEGNILGNLGDVYYRLKNYSKAVEHFDLALKIAIYTNDLSNEANHLIGLGNVYFSLENYILAKKYFEEAREIQISIVDKMKEGITLQNLGNVYKKLEEYSQATEFFDKSLEIARNLGDKKNEAQCLANLASLFCQIGEIQKGKEYLEKSLAILVPFLGSEHPFTKTAKENLNQIKNGLNMNNLIDKELDLDDLGEACNKSGDYEKAIGYYLEALNISRTLRDKQGEAHYLSKLGSAYNNIGNVFPSVESYQKALEILKVIDDKQGEVIYLLELGNVWQKLNAVLQTVECYEKAYEIARIIKDKQGEGFSLYNLGLINHKIYEYKKAIGYYERSYEVFMAIFGPDHTYTKNVQINLSKAKSKLSGK